MCSPDKWGEILPLFHHEPVLLLPHGHGLINHQVWLGINNMSSSCVTPAIKPYSPLRFWHIAAGWPFNNFMILKHTWERCDKALRFDNKATLLCVYDFVFLFHKRSIQILTSCGEQIWKRWWNLLYFCPFKELWLIGEGSQNISAAQNPLFNKNFRG